MHLSRFVSPPSYHFLHSLSNHHSYLFLPSRRLSAPSMSTKQSSSITWANQTFGALFESDGRPMGVEVVETVNCANGACPVKVKAPEFVLVFLTDESSSAVEGSYLLHPSQSTLPDLILHSFPHPIHIPVLHHHLNTYYFPLI
jgi:hypothetical protein